MTARKHLRRVRSSTKYPSKKTPARPPHPPRPIPSEPPAKTCYDPQNAGTRGPNEFGLSEDANDFLLPKSELYKYFQVMLGLELWNEELCEVYHKLTLVFLDTGVWVNVICPEFLEKLRVAAKEQSLDRCDCLHIHDLSELDKLFTANLDDYPLTGKVIFNIIPPECKSGTLFRAFLPKVLRQVTFYVAKNPLPSSSDMIVGEETMRSCMKPKKRSVFGRMKDFVQGRKPEKVRLGDPGHLGHFLVLQSYRRSPPKSPEGISNPPLYLGDRVNVPKGQQLDNLTAEQLAQMVANAKDKAQLKGKNIQQAQQSQPSSTPSSTSST
jgi:hypothetical protein